MKKITFMTLAVVFMLAAAPVPALAQQTAAPATPDTAQKMRKIACIGDSITQGVGAAHGMSWPDQLGKMLGDKWEVKNFGVSGRTLLKSGDLPYQKEGAFTNAKNYNPDGVVIILGTNDTKPHNWAHKGDFEADYKDLIKQFAELPSKPKIFICYPPYIAQNGNFGITEENTKAEIPMIDNIARATQARVIDVHAALLGKDALIPDKVHPNTEGATEIAKAVYKALTGKDYTPPDAPK
jgi:lysophospholipase L1-like esterase